MRKTVTSERRCAACGSPEMQKPTVLFCWTIPFLGVYYGEVMEWQEKSPELCYLRGMYSYSMQDMEGLDREIQNVKNHRPPDRRTQEIFLNLNYVKPDLHLNDWLQMLEDSGEEYPGMRLYDMLGNSVTFLCGLRDISGLFACPKNVGPASGRSAWGRRSGTVTGWPESIIILRRSGRMLCRRRTGVF